MYVSQLPLVVLGIVAFHYAYICLMVESDSDGYRISKRTVSFLQGSDEPHDKVFDTCLLAEPPAWTESMSSMLNRTFDPLATCNHSFVPVTVLGEDGRIRLNPMYNALEHAKERTINFGEWHKLDENFVFATDIIEVECNGTNDDPYTWLHQQIWKGPQPRNPAGERPSLDTGVIAGAMAEKEFHETGKRKLRPGVHLILFDSIASPQAKRSFPKTVAYIEKNFDAVHFRHVNRVGENSHPNGVAFLFNKMLTPIDRHIFGGSRIEPDFSHAGFCARCHDNDSFILQQFEEKRASMYVIEVGYKTMMAEDWASGVFNWPGCCGFVKQPTTHYMRPFQNRYEQSFPQTSKQMSSAHCLEPHMYLLEYLEKFIRAYPDTPLASLIWASCLGHDSANNVFHADSHLHYFFERNHDQLDDSFIFLMGDHGLRMAPSPYRFEASNPMLWIAPPKALRSNSDMMRNMRRNAGQLVTHFDTYATFVDIVRHAPASNFTEWMRTYQEPGDRGGSLLRPLPSGQRNCRTLPIPPEYCLCEINRTMIQDEEIKQKAGIAAVVALNSLIQEAGLTSHCVAFHLNQVAWISSINGTEGLHELMFYVLPSGGSYKTFMRLTEDGEFDSSTRSFIRLNEYGRTADCISDNELRSYCYCRNMTTTSKLTTEASTTKLTTEVTSTNLTTEATTTKIATRGAAQTDAPSPRVSPQTAPSSAAADASEPNGSSSSPNPTSSKTPNHVVLSTEPPSRSKRSLH